MMQSLTITVLVENTAMERGLLGEHGLSFLIETERHRVLFDTGQGLVLEHNVKQLGLNLNPLDAIALSHGHYDHSGGLESVLKTISPSKLYLHSLAIKPKYSRRGNIGFSLDLASLKRQVKEIIWTEKPTEIVSGIFATGLIPRHHPLEDTGGDFWHDCEHKSPDQLFDDQALWIDSPQGLVVILGCAHAGVINTLDYIAKITGKQTITAVIGGMHLLKASQERITATIETLNHYQVQQVGANHCTGIKAISRLWAELGDRFIPFPVGSQLKYSSSMLS
jgi:7,8-dihydropterin-6-yl-methyl-4-(beta-D-ribofuranosyl)aminobenzene 5'-phosphate synthase